MLIGGFCSIVTGLAVAWNMQMFGTLVGEMVDAQLVDSFKEVGIDISGYIKVDITQSVTTFACGSIIISVIMLGLSYVSITLFNYTSQRQTFRIRAMYFKSVLHQKISWYDVMSCGDISSRLTE